MSAGRYLVLCSVLFVLMLAHSWSDAWVGDFWIYVATVGELCANPLAPHNPLLGADYPFPFLSPYTWALGAACRLSGLRPFDVLALQGLVNLLFLLASLYLFLATWVGRSSAAFYAVLFTLFLWGPEPWRYSGFFHFGGLALVLPYPSTFATALALASLAAVRAVGAIGWRWAPVAVPVLALLWIVHPINGLFLCTGVLASSLERRQAPWYWAALALAVAASLALAMAWPLYPVKELWLGQLPVVHEGNDAMYDRPLARIAPALLGTPWLIVRLRRHPRDPLAVLCLLLAALVAYGGLFAQWSYGRLISHAVLVLHIALADAAASLEGRLRRLRGGAVLQHALAPACTALLLGVSWSSVVAPVLSEAWRGDPRWLSFLESRLERDDVVLTDLGNCWHVPSFRGRVVAYPMHLPFVPDHAERVRSVVRFFERGVPREERNAILSRYDVTHLLVPRDPSDVQAGVDELLPLGHILYSSREYVLLKIERAVVPAAGPSVGEERGGVHARREAARLEQMEPDGPLLLVQHFELRQDFPRELDAAGAGSGDDPPVPHRELVPVQRASRVAGRHAREPASVVARVRSAFQQARSSQRDGGAADRRHRDGRGQQLPQLRLEARDRVVAPLPVVSAGQQQHARVAWLHLLENDVRDDP
jgi:hypothetical protein